MKIVLGCDLFPYFGIVLIFLLIANSSIPDFTHLFLQYWTPVMPLASCSVKDLLCADPRLWTPREATLGIYPGKECLFMRPAEDYLCALLNC